MRRTFFAIICVLLIFSMAGMFFGCVDAADDGMLSIVCTIFPVYDWARNIVGDVDGVKIILLMDSGVDLHSFDPSVDDIVTVGKSDLFVYVGGESDESWVDRVLAQKTNSDLTEINLMEALADRVREEEDVVGAEGDGDEETEYDEHIWLSLKNAQAAVERIASVLGEIDVQNAAAYKANAEAYSAKLADLDNRYADMVASAKNNTLVFGDRFPFLYMVRDYGLNYYAAFKGCAAAEAGASAETLTFLAGKLDELDLNYILEIEGSSKGIAKNVVALTENKSQQILTLDSMQTVTAARVADGADYLDIMENNLKVLSTALN